MSDLFYHCVRKTGLEPVRPCERHPLKMVRLPISPLPQRGHKGRKRSEDGKISGLISVAIGR